MVASESTQTLLGRLDTRAVVITPAAPLEAVPELAGFDARLRPNGALAVTYKTGASSVEAVLAAVRGAGVQIKDLATEDPDLEDVFLALTYGDPNAPRPDQGLNIPGPLATDTSETLLDLETAIQTLEDVTRVDLERCEAAIRAGDQLSGVAALEQAFAKIDSVIDILRSLPRG